MILRGDSDKYEYLGENETKFETILTHWSVVKAGSNNEKNKRSKIWLDRPYTTNKHFSIYSTINSKKWNTKLSDGFLFFLPFPLDFPNILRMEEDGRIDTEAWGKILCLLKTPGFFQLTNWMI